MFKHEFRDHILEQLSTAKPDGFGRRYLTVFVTDTERKQLDKWIRQYHPHNTIIQIVEV